MLKPFDINMSLVTPGNTIVNKSSGDRQKVASVDKVHQVIVCESEKKIGFSQLNKAWTKQ